MTLVATNEESGLTAEDLWPLVQKLPHHQQVRLAKLALAAAATDGEQDRDAYSVSPPGAAEFSSEDDPLAWEAEGWETVNASR